jgi:hypothetical protein
MAKTLDFATKASVLAAACVLAVSLAEVARAGDTAQLAGRWTFDASQSDDAQQKVHEAQQDSKINAANNGNVYPGSGGQYPGTGGQYPGGGYPGGGYPGGGMGRGGMGGIWGPGGGGMGRPGHQSAANRAGVSSEEWDRLAENPKYLSIDQHSKQIVVTDDNDNAQTFYADGKKHDDKDASGKKVSTKSDWESGVLTAETKLSHSEKLTQTFRLSDDGKQLFVTTVFEDPSLNGPLSIRRVYDLAKSPSK